MSFDRRRARSGRRASSAARGVRHRHGVHAAMSVRLSSHRRSTPALRQCPPRAPGWRHRDATEGWIERSSGDSTRSSPSNAGCVFRRRTRLEDPPDHGAVTMAASDLVSPIIVTVDRSPVPGLSRPRHGRSRLPGGRRNRSAERPSRTAGSPVQRRSDRRPASERRVVRAVELVDVDPAGVSVGDNPIDVAATIADVARPDAASRLRAGFRRGPGDRDAVMAVERRELPIGRSIQVRRPDGRGGPSLKRVQEEGWQDEVIGPEAVLGQPLVGARTRRGPRGARQGRTSSATWSPTRGTRRSRARP